MIEYHLAFFICYSHVVAEFLVDGERHFEYGLVGGAEGTASEARLEREDVGIILVGQLVQAEYYPAFEFESWGGVR